ncbi:MAG: hypothetical protein ACJAS4_000996 [Bacteriovoracaceae bacterium]|jgi:hypothetical protein
MKILGLISLLFIYTSCSPAPEQTKAKISFGASYASDNFPGGLFLLAHNISESKISMVRIVNQNHEFMLDNGKWEFASMGWEGVKPLSGNIKCFMSSKYELDGNNTDIEFTLSDEGCSHEFFTPKDFSSGAPKKPNPITVTSCAFMDRKNKEDYKSDYNCEDTPGLEKSYKLKLYNVPLTNKEERDSQKFAPYESGCFNLDSINYSTTGPSVPAFNDFPMTIETFSSVGCTGEKTVHHFPKGIRPDENSNSGNTTDGVASNSNPLAFSDSGDGTKTKVFLNDEICSSPGFQSQSFSDQTSIHSLDGSSRPFYICNETQFGNINNNPGDTFLIAHDIDFNNDSNNYISGSFYGNLDGQNFALKNYQVTDSFASPFGLFENVISGAVIKNLYIENFDMSLTGTSEYGLLAGSVSSTTASITISNITIDDSSTITSNLGTVGGVIGKVYSSSSNSVSISNIFSSADVSITDATTKSTGGLFGELNNASAPTSKIIISDSSLSNSIINVDNSATSSQGTGGIVGKSKASHFIRVNNDFISTITGPNYLGGIIGLSTADLISQARVDTSIFNNSFSQEYFGGVIGKATLSTSNTFTAIADSIITVAISDAAGGFPANKVGGVIGGTYFPGGTTNASFLVKNNKVKITTLLNGSNHGGLLGNESPIQSGAGNFSLFVNNIVNANLIAFNPQNSIQNSFKGGLFGTLSGGQVKRNIVISKLMSVGPIGGLAGHVSYNGGGGPQSNIQENYIHSRITTHNDGTYIQAGGAVGIFASSGPIMSDTKVEGYVFILDSGTNCDGTGGIADQCGRFIGNNQSSSGVSKAVINNRLFVDTNGSSTIDIGTDTEMLPSFLAWGNLPAPYVFQNDSLGTVPNLVSIGSGPWDGSWNAAGTSTNSVGLTFYNNHLFNASIPNVYDLDSEVTGSTLPEFPEFKAGNRLDPISIANKEDWNAVGSNAYLLSKSFQLLSNISFNNNSDDFVPFGGKGNMGNDHRFTGQLYSNGYKLENIYIKASDYTANHPIGIIRALGLSNIDNGEIGEFQDPLYVNNLHIEVDQDQNSNVGGLVGSFEGGSVWARLTNVKIETTGSGEIHNAGGLVGSISSQSKTEIYNSLFQGTIENNGTSINIAGGLIGKVDAVAFDQVTIKNSAVHSKKISASGASQVGGFIGYLTHPAGAYAYIDSNYVFFNQPGSVLSGGTEMGGFIAAMQVNGTNEIHNNFVDLSNVPAPPSAIEMFSEDGSASGGGLVENYVIKGIHSNAGNAAMVGNSYGKYIDMYNDGEDNNLGLFSTTAKNAFYYDIGNPTDLTDDRVKLYWEYKP